MQSNLPTVQKWIGLSEGGYVNNPKDPGGATDRGITQRAFDSWNKSQGKPLRPVKGISKSEAEQIIADNYLRPVQFDRLPSGLDYAVADYSVNSGPARAVKELQRLVNVPADGIMGNQTIAAIRAVERDTHAMENLITDYCEARIAFMKQARHPKTKALLWTEFGKGWTRRVMGNQPGAQPSVDQGVIDRAIRLWKIRGDEGQAIFIADPIATENARATEPVAPATMTDDPSSVGGLMTGAGAVSAAVPLLSAVGGLHPIVQAAAIGALLLIVAGAWWTLRDRAQKRALGL